MGRRMRERMRRKSGVRRGLHTQMREGLRRRVASAHEGGQLPPACGVRQARTQSGSGDGRSEDPTGAKGSNTAAACAGVGGCRGACAAGAGSETARGAAAQCAAAIGAAGQAGEAGAAWAKVANSAGHGVLLDPRAAGACAGACIGAAAAAGAVLRMASKPL